MSVRKPAVSGSFYPAYAQDLTRQLDSLMYEVAEPTGAAPKMLIVPHAGYDYSGHVAAAAYRCLRHHHDQYKRVVIMGPSHCVALSGIAAPSATRFDTPLGAVEVATQCIAGIESLPFMKICEDTHRLEHSLEVQLPFLQSVLDDFEVVPLVVGETTALQIKQILDALWGGDETLIIVSTDLSHFLFDSDAKRVDQSTTAKIKAMESNVNGKEACGHYPLNGALAFAKAKGLMVEHLCSGNSSEKSGDRDQVVGYASFVLF